MTLVTLMPHVLRTRDKIRYSPPVQSKHTKRDMPITAPYDSRTQVVIPGIFYKKEHKLVVFQAVRRLKFEV